MMRRLPIPLWLQSGLGAVALFLALSGAVPAAATPPPPHVQQALPEARLWGQGQMRFLGLRIYDARLWAGPQFQAEQFQYAPLALELTYHRAFSGAAIAQRSIEEIKRQGALPPAQAQRWQKALAELLPDVQAGDRLTGLYQPAQGMRLWRGQQALGAIEDADLAQRFFAIWLAPSSSDPRLRAALLQGETGAQP